MVGCNRLLKIIVLFLGIYVLVINVILWANNPSINVLLSESNENADYVVHQWYNSNFDVYHATHFTNYRGFKWFFEHLSEYPGLSNVVNYITRYGKIISGYKTPNLVNILIFDVVMNILKGITAPFHLLMALALDIFNNVKWFFGFIVEL